MEFIWNSTVTGLRHGDRLTGLELTDVHTGEKQEITCDGLFVSIGRQPNTALFPQLEQDEGGYLLADETTKTSIPGVFAVGDVRTKELRQIVTAVSDGAAAAHYAEQFLYA